MDIDRLMRERHSVRKYYDQSIEEDKVKILSDRIAEINATHGLHFQLVLNEPEAIAKFPLNYGRVEAYHYIAVVGNKRDKALEGKCGYFGEELVLMAQDMGLNTVWLAASFSKRNLKITLDEDETVVAVIAIGYGLNQGVAHKCKKPEDVSNVGPDSPAWFAKGVEYALLAPTALNQQKFTLTLVEDGKVQLKKGLGPCVDIDLGIVRYHFELGAGKQNFIWKE